MLVAGLCAWGPSWYKCSSMNTHDMVLLHPQSSYRHSLLGEFCSDRCMDANACRLKVRVLSFMSMVCIPQISSNGITMALSSFNTLHDQCC